MYAVEPLYVIGSAASVNVSLPMLILLPGTDRYAFSFAVSADWSEKLPSDCTLAT